jgi:poly(hydroxyalkanoate) granule-associated protein
MVGKQGKAGDAADNRDREDLAGTIRDSAQQIWLAGLGAFAKAQQEGGKVFDALVKEGASMQRKTQAAAEERFSEATTRMADMANDLSSRASGQWGKFEGLFDESAARALKKLGVPSSKDLDALSKRIDELARNVARLSAKQARPSVHPQPKTVARKRPSARKTPGTGA